MIHFYGEQPAAHRLRYHNFAWEIPVLYGSRSKTIEVAAAFGLVPDRRHEFMLV